MSRADFLSSPFNSYVVVDTIDERNAVPAGRRTAGMTIFVADVNRGYVLAGDMTTWNEDLATSILDGYIPTSSNRLIPSGGDDGYLLQKASGADYDVTWFPAEGLAAGNGVPVGGAAGQILSKIDGTDFNAEWRDDGYFTAPITVHGGAATGGGGAGGIQPGIESIDFPGVGVRIYQSGGVNRIQMVTNGYGAAEFAQSHFYVGGMSLGNAAINTNGLTSQSNPTYQFQGDTDTGLYLSSADVVGLAAGGAGRLLVSTTNATANVNVIPGADSTYDVGTDSVRFSNVYADNLHGAHVGVTGNTNSINDILSVLDGYGTNLDGYATTTLSNIITIPVSDSRTTGINLPITNTATGAVKGLEVAVTDTGSAAQKDWLKVSEGASTFFNVGKTSANVPRVDVRGLTSSTVSGFTVGSSGTGFLDVFSGGSDPVRFTTKISSQSAAAADTVRFGTTAGTTTGIGFPSSTTTSIIGNSVDQVVVGTTTTVNNLLIPSGGIQGHLTAQQISDGYANASLTNLTPGINLGSPSAALVDGYFSGNIHVGVGAATGGGGAGVVQPSIESLTLPGTGMRFYYGAGVDKIQMVTAGYQAMEVTQSNVTIGGGTTGNGMMTTNGGIGAANTCAFGFAGDQNTGMYRHAADTLGLSAGGVGRWLVSTTDATSNVNITPGADSTYNIGTDSVRFTNVYADNLHGQLDGGVIF